jgi:type VI protein secretion system component Hcp
MKGRGGWPLGAIGSRQGFTFHKDVGKATPKIQEAMLRSIVLPRVQIKVLSSHVSGFTEPIAVDLQDLEVTGFRIHGSGVADTPAAEEVTLHFGAATGLLCTSLM